MRAFNILAGIFVAVGSIATQANATPLALSYTVGLTSPGTYHYDFALTLNNNDNSWSTGEQFDWIIFGDRSGYNQPSGFGTDFFNTASPYPLVIQASTGGHQGPTLAYGANNVSLPGWEPTAIGQSLTWSGDSHTFLGAGSLYWSSLVNSANDSSASFVLARDAAVPEPATWALMLVGMGVVGFAMRRYKSVAAAYA